MEPSDLEEAVLRGRDLVDDLLREADEMAESTAAGPDDEHDIEGSSIGFERARVAALLTRAEESLEQLEAAVGRRRSGKWRTCRRCSTAIGEERLEALPATELCIGCAASRPTT